MDANPQRRLRRGTFQGKNFHVRLASTSVKNFASLVAGIFDGITPVVAAVIKSRRVGNLQSDGAVLRRADHRAHAVAFCRHRKFHGQRLFKSALGLSLGQANQTRSIFEG